jgi:hypothetical protein
MAMHDKLYIPKTITIGFRKRDDTFTGKLAYVIYTDHTGKLRKEASWNSWRDHKIATVTVDNAPQQGFTFNKGVKRDGYWGSGRSVIRVWDPRDFEFEISVDNLIGILMHADVSKRDITEPCVFAWNGTELILLPTNSLEYQESTKHTEKQGKKFSAKELTAGFTYSLKEDRTTRVVYLGRFPRFTIDQVDEDGETTRRGYFSRGRRQTLKSNKGHVFINVDSKMIVIKDPSKYIDEVVSEEVHPAFASFVDTYYSSAESQPIAGVRVNPVVPSDDQLQSYYSWYSHDWIKWNDEFVELAISAHDHTITVQRLARWDDTSMTCQTSHQGSARTGYYYGQQTHPYNPTKVALNDPALAAHVRQMSIDYNAFFPKKSNGDRQYSYEERYVVLNKAHCMLATKYGVGQLQFVLADGKFATDHIA